MNVNDKVCLDEADYRDLRPHDDWDAVDDAMAHAGMATLCALFAFGVGFGIGSLLWRLA